MSIEDNGPGWSLEIKDNYQIPIAQHMMTILSSCHRMKKNKEFAGQLCKVPLAAITGCSEWCELEIRKNGIRWIQKYRLGKAIGTFWKSGKTNLTGTKLTFMLDRTVLKYVHFDRESLRQRLNDIQNELPGVIIDFES